MSRSFSRSINQSSMSEDDSAIQNRQFKMSINIDRYKGIIPKLISARYRTPRGGKKDVEELITTK